MERARYGPRLSLPSGHQPQLGECDHYDDGEVYVAHRGGIAKLQRGEGVGKDLHHRRFGGADRPAARQNVGFREHLEGADNRQGYGEDDHRPQQRDRDVEEDLRAGGAVHQRSLSNLARDGLHAGQHDHGIVAQPRPDHQQSECNARPPGIIEPGDRPEAEDAEEVVSDACPPVEDQLESIARRHHRRDIRHEEQRAPETLQLDKVGV